MDDAEDVLEQLAPPVVNPQCQMAVGQRMAGRLRSQREPFQVRGFPAILQLIPKILKADFAEQLRIRALKGRQAVELISSRSPTSVAQ